MFYYLETFQLIALLFAVGCLSLSLFLFEKKKIHFSLTLLILSSLFIGFMICSLNPFLNIWDEQYHALVAKNMMQNPFKPVLYQIPVLPYHFQSWTNNHIWLHKQPLFLWQIALSLKVFGTHEIAVRIPSIIMHSVMIFFIYRMGKLAISERVGYIACLLFTFSFYQLEIVSGSISTDHNDVAFLFYVTGSIWAWFEYINSKKRRFLFLLSLLVGFAILVKWLVGLLIFSIWFVWILSNYKTNPIFRWTTWKYYTFAFIGALLIMLPWQWYILRSFPLEAAFEFKYNALHFSEALEGHGGTFWFHFEHISSIYGSGTFIPLLILLGWILSMVKSKNKAYRLAFGCSVLVVYLFYSLAKTKMVSFTIIVSPILFIGLATLIHEIFNYFEKVKVLHKINPLLRTLILFALLFTVFKPRKIKEMHTFEKNPAYLQKFKDKMGFIHQVNLNPRFQHQKHVFFNQHFTDYGHVNFMFYTSHIGYDFIPTEAQIKIAKKSNYPIVIVDNGALPEFITKDSTLILLKNT